MAQPRPGDSETSDTAPENILPLATIRRGWRRSARLAALRAQYEREIKENFAREDAAAANFPESSDDDVADSPLNEDD